MYQIDDRDSVIELTDLPPCDIGAPIPAVVAAEHHLDLVYVVSEPDPNWDGSYAVMVGPNSDDALIARITFHAPYAHQFGPPNDEAFAGHPLASRGLSPYSACEVLNSSWIRSLEQMNAVHEYHDPSRFYGRLRHFILAFHDSTFECAAEGYGVAEVRGSVAAVTAGVAATWS